MSLGIANLKPIVIAGCKITKTGLGIFADGKFSFSDWAAVVSLGSQLLALGRLSIPAILPEVKDLSFDEIQELVAVAIGALKA